MSNSYVRRRQALTSSCLAASLLIGGFAAQAQTLARPGFTTNTEPWWRNAVFYRIAPEHFQDSDGDGIGDLRGIAQRLDYLQALGVDAIVLQLPFNDTGFDDLFAEASRRHIRLVIQLSNTQDTGEGPAATASHWLTRGAAGILLPSLPAGANSTNLITQLRRAAAHMPGERIIIPEASSITTTTPPPNTKRAPSGRAAKADPQLALTTLPITATQTSSMQEVAEALKELPTDGSAPLLQLPPAGQSSNESKAEDKDAAIAATTLLSQHASILLEYGQELGQTAPARMPWTPSNVTLPPEPPPEPAKAVGPTPGSNPDVYGPYRPYVPPPPQRPKPPAPPPGIVVLPDPDSLPGFTTKANTTATPSTTATPKSKAEPSPEEAARSVVLQERNPQSTLSLYRRLLALHRANPAFRNGSLILLHGGNNAPADSTVAWLRQPPPGTRTATPIVIAVNCGDTPAELQLEDDLARLHLGKAELRSLFTGGQILGRTRLTLAPHAVFLGELVP